MRGGRVGNPEQRLSHGMAAAGRRTDETGVVGHPTLRVLGHPCWVTPH